VKKALEVVINGKRFLKSSYSGRAYCIAARECVGGVEVLDTKSNEALCFSKEEWLCFLRAIKEGEFDCLVGSN